ncbi:MAG: trans-aconitate 2-methyltransferase [Granulosicoccus sp.]
MLQKYDTELEQLSDFYTDLVTQHGCSPEGVQHKDLESQESRIKVLTGIGDLQRAKILDFGCGTGYLFDYLKTHCDFKGEYVGYDLSEKMVEVAANTYPEARFEQRNILNDGIPETFDYVLINGTFNNKLDDNWGLMTTLLSRLFAKTQRGIAFNALSTYIDFVNPGNYYVSPTDLFRYCKENLSPSVTLRHDYEVKKGIVPFEYTLYVYSTDQEVRAEREI